MCENVHLLYFKIGTINRVRLRGTAALRPKATVADTAVLIPLGGTGFHRSIERNLERLLVRHVLF